MVASSVHLVAGRIAADIAIDEGGPGAQFGTEQELCARYGVSPTIFRQAARLLEASGIAVMRPGNRGGLIANGAALDGVARTISTYFQFTAVSLHDAMSLTWTLMFLTSRIASERMTAADVDRIRVRLSEIEDASEIFESGLRRIDVFHQIALSTSNPLLVLLSRVMLSYFVDVIPFESITGGTPRVVVQPADIAEAVIRGDADGAASLLSDYRLMHEQIFGGGRLGQAHEPSASPDIGAGSSRTRSARVARQLLSEIRRMAWPVGARIGEEPELMDRYGVSRATFRQAVRMLEQYSAVETRRGPRGGLFVTAPNPDRVAKIAVAALRSAGATRIDSREARTPLMLLAFDLALARDGEHGAHGGLALFETNTATGERLSRSIGDLQRQLIRACANPPVAFAFHLIETFDREVEVDETRRAANLVDDFLDSYLARDFGRARRVLIDIARH